MTRNTNHLVKRLSNKIHKNQLDQLLNQDHISKAGKVFTPAEDYWSLADSGRYMPVSLRKVERVYTADIRPYFRLALARYASINSADSVYNICSYLSMIENDYIDLDNLLDPIQFISIKNKRGKAREYQVSTLRGFFRFWHSSGLWGVSDEFVRQTNQLSFKANEKGRAVLASDPIEGPFTPIEMQGIYTGLTNAFAERKLDVTHYLLARLYAELGQRSAQYAQLRIGDFSGDLVVNMPRSKQRNGSFRVAFSRFEVSEDLYELVQLQKRVVEARLGAPSVVECLPLFPNYAAFNAPVRSAKDVTEAHHARRDLLRSYLAVVEQVIDVKSERTGQRLHLTPRRFRRTLGSDLAREGYGVSVIATALDHEDNQNAGVYVETSAEVATRLDQKLGKMLAPVAQAFAGVIVMDERSAIRGDDPSSRVRTHDGEDAIGSCGEMGFCGANAPVACYTCVKFQPWLDAPHEEVLIKLYDEREETLRVTGDNTIASILDRSILAVEDVIRRCESMKAGSEVNND